MRMRSLESRIIIPFLVLILAVQIIVFFVIQAKIQENARTSIHTELDVSERVFGRLLEQYSQKLTQAAHLLAEDYSFKSAISSDDHKTIMSALSKQHIQVGAHTILIGPDRSITASIPDRLGENLRLTIMQLVGKAEQSDAVGISIVDDHPYQIAVVPVKAPLTIAWVAIAFPIDRQIVEDLRQLSSLQVTILTSGNNNQWRINASTFPEKEALNLIKQLRHLLPGTTPLPQITLGDSEFIVRLVELAKDADTRIIIVLQCSISEAVAPYRLLQMDLVILAVLSIAMAVASIIFIARRITLPLRELQETAKRLGAGDYKRQIDIDRNDEIGELSRAFASMRDGISRRELEIRRLAYWDTLTGLPNRAQFAMLLNEAITEARQNNEACHVLMMDLDHFRNVNDVMGHDFGDALLRQVAERLRQQIIRKIDKIARLGGDEFAILLPRIALDGARSIAGRILESFEIPILLEDQNVDLGAGIGIAGFPEHGTDAQALLSRAEVAMYAAKASGNGTVVYSPVIDRSSQQNLSLLSELRRAIGKNELQLYVQPKVMLDDGNVIGLEALVHWEHPERGILLPDQFIPFAEKTGFVRTITCWVLNRAAVLCNEFASQGIHLKMSVNLSTRDLMDSELPSKFGEILSRYKLPPNAFCLEITESTIMDDPVRAQQTLDSLHAMGMDLSIDDFGTGYSSLAYLKRLPVQELKIDKSFVLKMERDADDAKIVKSTIDLGHNLGLKVVAEGIEDIAVWELLAKMGCDQGQGYFISKPMPAEHFPGWMKSWVSPARNTLTATSESTVND